MLTRTIKYVNPKQFILNNKIKLQIRPFNNFSKNASELVKKLPQFENHVPNQNFGIKLGTGLFVVSLGYLCIDSDDDDCVKKKIKRTYAYVMGGLGITGVSAYGFYKVGLHKTIMRSNPWIVIGVSLTSTIPLLIGTLLTDYKENPIMKHICWFGFNGVMAGTLSTVCLFGGPLVAQAGLATTGIMTGLSLVASSAKPGSLQQLELPMGVGLGALVAAGLGNMIFPIPFLHNVVLYGGLIVFSGLTMTDTQRMLEHAKHSSDYDPINESLNIYLDYINLFIRIIQILSELEKSKKNR